MNSKNKQLPKIFCENCGEHVCTISKRYDRGFELRIICQMCKAETTVSTLAYIAHLNAESSTEKGEGKE